MPVKCNIHPWMKAYVVLRSSPYMAKTDQDGRFTIKNLPAGKHVFRVWHERAGYVKNVQLGDHKIDSKGRLEVTIRTGSNPLSTATLPPETFELIR